MILETLDVNYPHLANPCGFALEVGASYELLPCLRMSLQVEGMDMV